MSDPTTPHHVDAPNEDMYIGSYAAEPGVAHVETPGEDMYIGSDEAEPDDEN